jgi:hypothetical protein
LLAKYQAKVTISLILVMFAGLAGTDKLVNFKVSLSAMSLTLMIGGEQGLDP